MRCNGLPSQDCPFSASGDDVTFCYADLDLCKHCERVRKELNGIAPLSDLSKPYRSIKENESSNSSDKETDTIRTRNHEAKSKGNSTNKVLTGPNISVEKVLIEPVIAYIVFFMQSGTFDNIKNATLGAFTEAEISSAKDDLWTHCGSRIIGEKKRRKETSARTIKEANIIDIMQAISQLDKSDSLPNMAINARSLQFIPRSHPEELNNISLVDRLNRLEARMTNMQTQLDGVTAHNMFLRDKLLDKSSYASKVSSNAIVYGATSTAPAIPVNASIGNNKSGSLDVRPKIPNLPSLASNQQSTISTSLSSKPKNSNSATEAVAKKRKAPSYYRQRECDCQFKSRP